ncbi:sucrose-phosphate phosphatase [Tumidithrix helvetica PCC 7403]|uniref:sucrose-phosphate phosphatase n=1 Tax=Tumidithrix helvetica TaxID=3457545 RepID=UPI003C82EDCF
MKFLLATDLDNTLIGDDRATIALNQKLASAREQVCLVYATGRSLVSYQELCRDFLKRTDQSLLEPDYLVTGVGSQIYSENTLDRKWAEQISRGWEREAIALLAKSMPELLPQSQSEQNQWKLSYLLDSKHNDAIVKELKDRLDQMGIKAQIIFSSDRDLDILPKDSGKGKAVNYLRDKLQIPREYALVCGDSGNDIAMFEQMTLGAIVRNSQQELLVWQQLHSHPYRYLSPSAYAWGILEAIAHFKIPIFV